MKALPLACLAFLSAAAALAQASNPLVVTHGGTYSGRWSSGDARIAAVTIRTTQPVTLQNAAVSGQGNLIVIGAGANVTIRNVTGTALDPGVAGASRGAFVLATGFHALTVDHCTITGTAFGIKAVGAQPSTLVITNNKAVNLEDRASDGHGGLLNQRLRLGHFVILDHIVAASGAEIAWNQSVQAIGTTSTEDAINIYESSGSPAHPIHVHDNYLEGQSTAVPGKHYTGTALIADGASTPGAAPTAWVLFENNQVVATAGTGVGIAYGHDITARNNRVVSCGVDAAGHRYAWGASATVLWNFYKSPDFRNNVITGTTGGMVSPASSGAPRAADSWRGPDAHPDPSNAICDSRFTDPCIVNGKLNPHAEDAERAAWTAKLAAAHQTVGAHP
ncbi:MAG TPA: hypothetical protein VG893_09580 [Terracidiphilus sp.]|nr:hypothetical protein [Terracidiphilus sp.]